MQPGTFMMKFGILVILGPFALLISIATWSLAPTAFCLVGGLLLSVPFTLQINAEKAKFVSIAENTNLTFNPDYHFTGEWNPDSPILWGELDGMSCLAWFRREPHLHRNWSDHKLNSRRTSNLVFEVMYERPIGLDLRVYPQNFLTAMSDKLIHGLFTQVQDIEVGDPAFDSSFKIQARDQELVRHFLTPERKAEITQFYQFLDTNAKLFFMTTVQDDRISAIFARDTRHLDPAMVTNVLVAMRQFAERIDQ